jgi:predicted Zn-dependent protease
MTTPNDDAADRFLNDNPMKSLLGIPEEALDAVMTAAYHLYQAGRFGEVEILCRGLIAADPGYWWSYSLYGATLRRVGKLREALEQIDKGLAHERGEPKLLLMRGEILSALGEWQEARADAGQIVAQAAG